jgi:uncharacterized protein YkwD
MRRAVIGLSLSVGLALLVAPSSGSGVVPAADTDRGVARSAVETTPRDHTDRERRYQRKVFHWTNVARRRHDLRPYQRVSCLRRVAVRWAEHLARTGDFEHQDLGVIFNRCPRATAAGENIARGGVTPRQMVRMWMRSPGHRGNILSRRFTHMGVGAAVRHRQWTGVQDFADLR